MPTIQIALYKNDSFRTYSIKLKGIKETKANAIAKNWENIRNAIDIDRQTFY